MPKPRYKTTNWKQSKQGKRISLSRLTFAYTEYQALTICSSPQLAPPHNHAHT
ncbi:conserved hypothetical protein [Vibrio chagasii]|uniref:Uncharacterized protein n=1 Tax=Vibrio coralliirubri TaxID=1516159 RepID=A0AA87C2K4_9VIBR|nr:conserved hypothetical protein [Vibrio chagasii]CDT90989.1 hypothetical protein VCR29J2_80019 [Vibrio coralliirubri]CDU00159.1 hypothetical protein VCR31J2_80020 [Vibrio coralliirubri]